MKKSSSELHPMQPVMVADVNRLVIGRHSRNPFLFEVLLQLIVSIETIGCIVGLYLNDCEKTMITNLMIATFFSLMYHFLICMKLRTPSIPNDRALRVGMIVFGFASVFNMFFTYEEITDRDSFAVSSTYCFGENVLIVRSYVYNIITAISIICGTYIVFKHAKERKQILYSDVTVLNVQQILLEDHVRMQKVLIASLGVWTVFSFEEIVTLSIILAKCDGMITDNSDLFYYFNCIINMYMFGNCLLNWIFYRTNKKQLYTKVDETFFTIHAAMTLLMVGLIIRIMVREDPDNLSDGSCHFGVMFLVYKCGYYLILFVVTAIIAGYCMKLNRRMNAEIQQ